MLQNATKGSQEKGQETIQSVQEKGQSIKEKGKDLKDQAQSGVNELSGNIVSNEIMMV